MPSAARPPGETGADFAHNIAPIPLITKTMALELSHTLSHEFLYFSTLCRAKLINVVNMKDAQTVQQVVELIVDNCISHIFAEISMGTIIKLYLLLQVIVRKKVSTL